MNQIIAKAIDIAGSQSELARRVGVGQSTISKWLNGAAISSRYLTALTLASEGEISTAELLNSLYPIPEKNTTESAV